MIVWIASYPRSGNTFFRIALHKLYGFKTYTGFMSGDDLELDLHRTDLTGHSQLPWETLRALQGKATKLAAALDRLHKADEVFFIKTHSTARELLETTAPAILIVRHPRDAILSFCRYIVTTQRTWKRYKSELALLCRSPFHFKNAMRALQNGAKTVVVCAARMLQAERALTRILRIGLTRSRRWSELNRSWMSRVCGSTLVVRYDDLVEDPQNVVAGVLAALGLAKPAYPVELPTFSQLNEIHPDFFPAGNSAAWHDQLSAEDDQEILRRHGPVMAQLGYVRRASTRH